MLITHKYSQIKSTDQSGLLDYLFWDIKAFISAHIDKHKQQN